MKAYLTYLQPTSKHLKTHQLIDYTPTMPPCLLVESLVFVIKITPSSHASPPLEATSPAVFAGPTKAHLRDSSSGCCLFWAGVAPYLWDVLGIYIIII